MKHPPMAYGYILVWGKHLGSTNPSYLEDQQKLASEEGAPLDALFVSQDGYWVTIWEVFDPEVLKRLGVQNVTERPVNEFTERIKERVRRGLKDADL